MGNQSSTVTAGIKDQVNSKSNAMNQLADVTCNGELADLAKEACKTGDHSELDRLIVLRVRSMLYNDGEGEMVPMSQVISQRHRERTGNPFTGGPSHLTKFMCWKLNTRGAVGETLLHTCFLSGLPKPMKLLAERLLFHFPKIINDFYINDEYYGETVLHMGIVSEDPEIVRYLLKCGADVNSRCSGNFFTCDDQKGSRADFADVEHAIIHRHTSYTGHLYWGEYPLSFAAVLSQVECFRMLVAHGADLNATDSNGNTVLHICTIHENWDMFQLAISLGANIHIQNRQHLTPLTLAAYLAKKNMMEHIVEEERIINWTYGGVQSAAYPLEHVDTIEPSTGKINRNSALAIVVYANTNEHLELLPNLLEQLVHKKWLTYGRRTLYTQLFFFILYFLTVMICFMIRPTPFERTQIGSELVCLVQIPHLKLKEMDLRIWAYHILNVMCVAGASLYLLQMQWHIKNVGSSMYFLSLSGFPARAIFLISCVNMVFSFVLRLLCLNEVEDIVWVITILLTSQHFLFFCRGFQSVGPFVLMLYKIIMKDLLRFFIIYLVIVIGFSQAFYIIFLGYRRSDPTFDPEKQMDESIMNNVLESYVRMFLMSLTEFSKFFEQLEECDSTALGKVTFVIYMLLVTVLLINMLIAMMTNTYTEISANSLEWLRQFSAICLMMEMSFDAKTRLEHQRKYSIPMEDGKRIALLLKTRLSEDEFEQEMATLRSKRLRFREEIRRRGPPLGGYQARAAQRGHRLLSQ